MHPLKNAHGASLDLTNTTVKKFYERYPYPNYPLLAKPLWQNGVLGSSAFARFLLGRQLKRPINCFENKQEILCIGCGEIQPYVLRKMEPSHNSMYFVDFSKKSLKRAQQRLC